MNSEDRYRAVLAGMPEEPEPMTDEQLAEAARQIRAAVGVGVVVEEVGGS